MTHTTSDARVSVPADLVEALREALDRPWWLPSQIPSAARGLVDAVEPPSEDEQKPTRWIDGDYAKGFRDGAEEALLSAADDIDAQDQRGTWYENWLRKRAAEYRPNAPAVPPSEPSVNVTKPDDLPPLGEWQGNITVEHYCPNCKTVSPGYGSGRTEPRQEGQ